MPNLNESHLQEVYLAWFEEFCYSKLNGPHLAPCEPAADA